MEICLAKYKTVFKLDTENQPVVLSAVYKTDLKQFKECKDREINT